MKNKKYHIVGTILKSNRIITETGNIHTPGIHIYIISFMGVVFIFRLLFITGSSLPSVHVGVQRQGSGIILYII